MSAPVLEPRGLSPPRISLSVLLIYILTTRDFSLIPTNVTLNVLLGTVLDDFEAFQTKYGGE